MKLGKKLFPIWLLVIIDLAVIAIYILGFYYLYYLTPRQLDSSGVKIEQQANSEQSDNNIVTSEGTAGNNTVTEDETNTATAGDTDTDGDTNKEDSTNSDTLNNSDTAVSFAEKFADKFTDSVVATENSYTSSDISLTVNKYTQGSGSNIVTYYVADIYVADITRLQSGFADDTYGIGYAEHVLDMDESLNAILAINGDYYGNGGNGVVIRNGEVYRSTTSDSDVCVLYYDGTMKTYVAGEFDVDQAIADGAYQAWSFGPELLDESGTSMTSFNADGHVEDYNPRSAIGYYEPGHYCLVVVDGRQSGYSVGMTLTQFSNLFEELGCTAAYNLDGGKSSEMTFNDDYVNQPASGGREVSDCIILKEAQ
jgi:exopolysaccharide biosynthesis protein